MIELKTLGYKERYDLVRGFEPFFLAYRKPNYQKKARGILVGLFGVKFDNEICTILTAAAKAKRYSTTGVQFSLSKPNYTTASKITGQQISYLRMKKLLEELESCGYLELYLGYYKGKDNSMKSCLKFHPKLLNLLSDNACKSQGMKRSEGLSLVEVTNSTLSTKTRKVFKTNSTIKGVGEITKQIRKANKLYEDNEITFNGDVCCVIYKRRFSDSLNFAGRWYTIGTFQTEDKTLRHTIKINDQDTTEVDFRYIHPAIFATLSGIELTEGYDPYSVSYLLNTNLPFEKVRELAKQGLMSLFYANNRGTALYEIRRNLRKEGITCITEKCLLEALEEHNFFLHEYFYNKDNWKLAQYIDSQIATNIMMHFANKGEVCLCYHDSFIVKKDQQVELINLMKGSWEKVLGNIDNFKYKVEF